MSVEQEQFYTEEEFNQLRSDILEFFKDDEISKAFRLRKSTYKWSSTHRWTIIIDFYSNWRVFSRNDGTSPANDINLIKKLFDMAQKFVEKDDRRLSMIKFSNSGDFNFSFSFKPTILRAKELLKS